MSAQQELIAILIMGAATILWPLGGYRWKPFRRFILPVVILVLLLQYGLSWWQSILSAGTFCGVTHLGYGDKTPWWKPCVVDGKFRSSKALTALSYNIPALVIGWTLWFAITPGVFLMTFFFSNASFTARDFGWKVCEAIVGLSIAVTILGALQHPWR